MASKKFALEKGGQPRLEISWSGFWKNGLILFDGSRIGSFHDDKELRSGREYPLPDGIILSVRLQRRFLTHELHISCDGVPLPLSSSPPWKSSTQPAQSMTVPESLSFVAPTIPSTPHNHTDAGDAERIRLELSRTMQTRSERAPSSRIGSRPIRTDIRARPAPADSAASALRFVAYRCEISDSGIRAIYTNGQERDFVWGGIASIVIRQLPTGPPWEGKIFLDLVPLRKRDATFEPLRLFATTYVNYSFLPQGHSPSSQENLRRLANFVIAKNPTARVEPGTALFLQTGKNPPRFFVMAQFAEYDARYG